MARVTSRFGAYSTAREVAAGHDLSGKTAIVTGGATGIGIETARALAEAGAEVVLAVRKPELAEAAIADLARTAKGPVSWRMLDLASLASVRAFAQGWGAKPLHVLINNAGVMACPFAQTADGFEMQFGTNHLGHYLLSVLLAPALEAAGGARLVALSSTGHRIADVDLDDPHFERRAYDKWVSYGQSKTANAQFAIAFNARFAARGIEAFSVMPGGIMTPLQRHLPKEEMIAFGWINEQGQVRDGFKTPEQGASTTVWAALAPELAGQGGLYLEDCAEAEPFDPKTPWRGVTAYARDPAKAEALWAYSARATGAG